MTEQTKAQRLAEEFDNGEPIAHTNQWKEEVSAELRRLDALVSELAVALEDVLSLDALREVDGYKAHEDAAKVLAKTQEQT